jgi:hypothetical protein
MESLEFVRLTGKGKFFLDESTVESEFVLYRNPHWIGIVTEEESLCSAANGLFSKSSSVQLSGTLNDGRLVKAGALHVTKAQIGSSPGVEFTAFEGVSLGQERDTPPAESRYPLTGYFDGEFALGHNGWDIRTIPCPSPKTAQALAKKWRCPVEGMVLRLRCEDSTMDEHREFARIVMALLSLASGTGVSCDRHFFSWGNEELENWRHMTGDEIGPGPIVPEFEIGRFLEQTLPAWQTLSKDQRDAVRLSLYHINQSALGYLDNRLFHIVQPWEFLAAAWGTHGELPDSVICLRTRLQQARRQWNEKYPNSDPNGFWGSRISSIFNWPKLRDAIERLSASFGIDLERVEFDLDLLKKARDSVAHSGKLSEYLTGPDRQALHLLTTGQYCLQLLLLRMLTYQGRVYHATGGWRTIVDIDKALTTVRMWRQPNKPIKLTSNHE